VIKPRNKIDLDNVSDDHLLHARICDLSLSIKGTWIEECIEELYKELDEKDIVFKPECYLADEWLTPEKETCIGIPFYLAHPKLIHLERQFMIDAEGETRAWCMKLLRHEAGHALCYAYKMHQRKRWQQIFGPSTEDYPETYKYRPYSKNYVRHLDGFYAQYHPEEDFVETFAIWLTPGLDWEKKYKGWKALNKLKYVDSLMKAIKGKKPPVESKQKFWRLSTLRYTLKNYYKKKRHFWAEDFPDFHDPFLRSHFSELNAQNKKFPKVTELIHKYRRSIINSVSKHSGERKYIINDLLKDLHKRSRELKLVNTHDESQVALHLSTYITSLIMNYQYTGRFRGEKRKTRK